MKKLNYLMFTTMVVVFTSCIDWDYFGLLNENQIIIFSLEDQTGSPSEIDSVNSLIIVPVNKTADRSNLAPTEIKLSSLATIKPGVGEKQDFRDTVTYVVTAEDGSIQNWKVIAEAQNDEIPNADYEEWYTVGSYQQPGPGSESTGAQYWDTPNRGSNTGGQILVNPADGPTGQYIHMETKITGLPPLIEVLSAASVFSGKFTDGSLDLNNPRKNINFGRNFGSKPISFSVDYKYTPGTDYRVNSQPSTGNDECDIYVLLQVRKDDGTRLRLGTAWHRSGETVSDWTNLKLDIHYGELPENAPSYTGLNQYEDEVETGFADASEFPTHIIIVYSASALGDDFTGAAGSILEIDNFALQYE
ncbi:PCMD domain-containing protein [Flammeovirga yaeyamensis]|uniref:PCMD domain-containing protein n=1 Tax=Flammeovirga yaeyamensis TaxID=367791 RepID=A0AAX1N8X5_9BACT|nr:PCMD domain-containing protein [Flammeovirga yaeyamensis]MBB3701436.1 hypothetical protein [Flammeovirga yaeyamensis]NMF38532.1 hypothetical protein [Flammeovirga yaeyamensis]QWG02388.1 PCMD domain-containing protein [Flammeovirga yaeyamensis]